MTTPAEPSPLDTLERKLESVERTLLALTTCMQNTLEQLVPLVPVVESLRDAGGPDYTEQLDRMIRRTMVPALMGHGSPLAQLMAASPEQMQ
jgi:hypothetical protein